MTPEEQFWWNWWIQFVVAFATTLAVIVALFGNWMRAHLFPPKLKLNLRSKFGEKTPVDIFSDEESKLRNEPSRREDGRFYHVTVSNESRWPKATQVQVYLLRVEEPGPDNNLVTTWEGEVPIRWRHQEIHPLTRTIGSPADCDLCSVIRGKWVAIHPLIYPNRLKHRRTQATKIVLSLQARADEGESPITRFKIDWDGQWEDGDIEMTHHLVVNQL